MEKGEFEEKKMKIGGRSGPYWRNNKHHEEPATRFKKREEAN